MKMSELLQCLLIACALSAPIVAFALGIWWERRKWIGKTINWNNGYDSGFQAARNMAKYIATFESSRRNPPSSRRRAIETRAVREIAELEELHKKEDRRTT